MPCSEGTDHLFEHRIIPNVGVNAVNNVGTPCSLRNLLEFPVLLTFPVLLHHCFATPLLDLHLLLLVLAVDRAYR